VIFQASVGIEIRDNAIIMAYLKASVRGPKLVAYGVYPSEDGQRNEAKAEQLGRVVKVFFDENRIPSATLFLGIPRESAILRYVDFPLVLKENLRDTLGYELEKYMPFSADDLYFDFQVISEDKNAEKFKVFLLAVKREFIEPFVSLQELPGLRLSGIEISSTAVANFFSSTVRLYEKDSGVLISIQKSSLEIDVLSSGMLTYSRPIDLSHVECGLKDKVRAELNKIKERFSGEPSLLKVMLCSTVDGSWSDHLKDNEAFDVRVFDPTSIDVPSYDIIPAYGLALKGLQDLPMDVNLLPPEMRQKPSRSGYYIMFGLVGMAIFLSLAWMGGIVFDTQRHVKQLDTELSRLRNEVEEAERTKAECAMIEQRIAFLTPLQRDRLIVLDAIRELSQRIPKTAWLLRFTYSDRDDNIRIEGWADSASGLIPLLDDSPLFKDVKFLSSITRSTAGKERFSIGLELVR
jgi:Tfp pilus assembly protein PilN